LRSSIIVLLGVLVVGSIVISIGFVTNQEIIEISDPYEKLEKYKIELEKINQSNLEMLKELELQIQNSDNIHLEQLTDEIEVINQVITENGVELEQVIQKLSQIKFEP
jgi:division protein CdvB (Snf7/Vps24/ESCRT-III family)